YEGLHVKYPLPDASLMTLGCSIIYEIAIRARKVQSYDITKVPSYLSIIAWDFWLVTVGKRESSILPGRDHSCVL
ncbi:MAG: hypothetical protein LBE38_08200, partial [Deltaproteobacteria bacterium]|nr:hypothetical protein [Deltaproteobacteria bacterium]